MTDADRTREQLLAELTEARRRIIELGRSDASPPQAEAELRRSLLWLDAVFAALDEAVLVVTPDRRLVRLNAAGERMFGYTEQELAQRSTEVLHVDREHYLQFGRRIEQAFDRGQPANFEFEGRRKNGQIFPSEHTVSLLRNDDGEHIGIVSVVRDITERRQAEEARRDLERQVQHAQKLESLGILAGGIAHDFNNILTALLGNAELALRQLPGVSPLLPLLGTIQEAGHRAADLTRQMLAYSGKGAFVVEDVDVNELVQDMSSLLASSTTMKVELSYELAPGLPWVLADATQLQQVVLNLVCNASEAMGEEGGVVRLRTYVTDGCRASFDQADPDERLATGPYVTIEVADTGCGMDDETRAKVFEPFFTTKFTGRGLGLATVQSIVRGHRGAIRVSTSPGVGSTFTVLLPARDHPGKSAVDRPAGAEQDWHGAGTILVVDDEPTVREVARLMLEELGFAVLTASGGVDALELFRRRHQEIRCVLLDLKMPGLGGVETHEALARIRPDVPVILTSGYGEQESSHRFDEQKPAGFLSKPYELRRLRAQLRSVLGGIDDPVRPRAAGKLA